MNALVIKRVWIEPAECTGCTLCNPEAPGLIEYAPFRDVSVVKQDVLHHTHDELTMLIDASQVCPMRNAFLVETEDGHIYAIPDDEAVAEAIRIRNYRWSRLATGARDIAPVA